MNEDWSVLRGESQGRRRDNRYSSAQVCKDHHLDFEVKNDGAHIIIKHNGLVADLWPGTGKYNIRSKPGYRRGVFNLLRELGVEVRR